MSDTIIKFSFHKKERIIIEITGSDGATENARPGKY